MTNGGEPATAGHVCDTCGSKFATQEALEVHRGSSHQEFGKPALRPNEALSFAPGGTVADFETGPKPGGKMDRETSRPAKGWKTPGEEGDPRKGLRNEGVAPIETPDIVAERSLSETPGARRSEPHSPSRKTRKKPAEGG